MATEPQRPPPAECFPPGAFLRDELEARGWTVDDLLQHAKTTRITAAAIEAVLSGGPVDTWMAFTLRRALGTSAQYWLNLSSIYAEWRERRATQKRPAQKEPTV